MILNLKLFKISVSLLVFVYSINAVGQDRYRRSYGDFQQPYEYTVSNFKGDEGKNILKIVVEIPYEQIHFEKDKNLFAGEYEITVFVYDPDYRLIADTTETKKIELNEYEMSIAKEVYSVHEWDFPVPEDEDYRIIFNLTDKVTQTEINKEIKFKSDDFERKKIDLSDIMFYESEYDSTLGKEKLTPNFHGFEGKKDIVVFFEIYNESPGDIVNVKYKVMNLRKKTMIEEEFEHEIKDSRDKVFVKIDPKKIYSGNYYFEVEVSDKKKKKKKTDRDFTYMWKGFPETELELERALYQMKYIKRGKYYNDVKKLPFEKKLAAFTEFWEKRDPTPGTEQNELMDAYYWRIYFANKAFKNVLRDGWDTDQGMIFVVFGPPDEVYERPFPSDGNYYQVWHYSYINTDIVFFARSSLDIYRLSHPEMVPFTLGDMFDLE